MGGIVEGVASKNKSSNTSSNKKREYKCKLQKREC